MLIVRFISSEVLKDSALAQTLNVDAIIFSVCFLKSSIAHNVNATLKRSGGIMDGLGDNTIVSPTPCLKLI